MSKTTDFLFILPRQIENTTFAMCAKCVDALFLRKGNYGLLSGQNYHPMSGKGNKCLRGESPSYSRIQRSGNVSPASAASLSLPVLFPVVARHGGRGI
jgi:hypothetical protein